jgi:3'(2'), 5'-bisphosphate nucleotidase
MSSISVWQRLNAVLGSNFTALYCAPGHDEWKTMNYEELIEPIVALAVDAGERILEVYATDFDVQSKADESPLTQADLTSHNTIVAGLEALTPDIPIISEEDGLPAFAERGQWGRYWLIDPLDGTKEFVNRNGEFTVNIALIEKHRPVFGVVHVPVQNKTYMGCEGRGAERRDSDGTINKICVSAAAGNPVRVVGSRSHRGASLDAYLDRLGDYDLVPMGSSLKFCVVAEGGADVYPRLGPTSEWDTAAAQAVVEQAGGAVLQLDGKALAYNAKENILNPWFIVVGAPDRDWLALLSDGE